MSRFAPTLPSREQDLSAIKTGEWPEREFPLGPRERPTRRQVIFKQSVLNDVYAHGKSAPEVEVCGVLVGNVYKDAMGPFVFVEANIRGNFSAGKAAQVTFTAKTWSHIQDVMDRDYPDLRILGWYHTHPGHGIFLSDMDLFIHKNFFSLPWHLAFVYDPQHQEEGLFAWRSGNLAIESFVVQKDALPQTKVARRVPDLPAHHPPHSGDTAGPGPNGSHAPAAAPAAASAPPAGSADAEKLLVNQTRPASAGPEVLDLSLRVQSLERKQRWQTAALALAVLVAVAWPLALAAFTVLRGGDDEPILSLPGMPSQTTSADQDAAGGASAEMLPAAEEAEAFSVQPAAAREAAAR